MVLPGIRPLSQAEWDELVAALRRGPTPLQVRIAEEARELVRNSPLRDPSTLKNMRRLDPDEVARRMDEKFAAEAARRKAAMDAAPRGPQRG